MSIAALCPAPISRGSDPMTTPDRPSSAEDLRELIADAASKQQAIELIGGGSKRGIGRPGRDVRAVHLGAMAGIVDYAPNELVLTTRPATPLGDIEALLAEHGQMLAFEPWDHACLFGTPAHSATIGGIVAAGVAGPRRVSAGGARDHLLGFEAVSGRGEIFRAGGKVVKNVTGFDISKVMAGSWGQLAVMTELTLKVLPRPRCTVTLAIEGLDTERAGLAMAGGMGSRNAVAAAAHVPASEGTRSLTALRVEGFVASVAARTAALIVELAGHGAAHELPAPDATRLWHMVTTASPLAKAETLWRAHVAPSRAAALARAVAQDGGQCLVDWAGAVLWIGAPANCDVRGAAQAQHGHAMLVRAPEQVRLRVPARVTGATAVAAIEARLRQAFDPAGILDPFRFG